MLEHKGAQMLLLASLDGLGRSWGDIALGKNTLALCCPSEYPDWDVFKLTSNR
jgi:hypothetical protein